LALCDISAVLEVPHDGDGFLGFWIVFYSTVNMVQNGSATLHRKSGIFLVGMCEDVHLMRHRNSQVASCLEDETQAITQRDILQKPHFLATAKVVHIGATPKIGLDRSHNVGSDL